MTNGRRVVITGMGAMTPLGKKVDEIWSALLEGKSGITKIKNVKIDQYPVKIAGEIKDFEPDKYFSNPKDSRRTDRYCQLGLAAGKIAYADSGIEDSNIDKTRIGVIIGSGVGGLASLESQLEVSNKRGIKRVSPFVIPMLISNMCSGYVSMEFGLEGPNLSVVTACATTNHAIGEAWRMIKFGDADAFVAGGAEAPITHMGLVGFSQMRALSMRNDEPERASRPFDTDRDGFVMGEGAGCFVVEELESARKRGAKIYAELVGYGLSGDAYHMTSPHPQGKGAAACMSMALKHASLNPEEVDYINAHGTSTKLGDVCETKAIKQVFGSWAKNGMLVSSTKSMTGHLLGAAGGVELLASIMAIREGIVPPTINLDNQDPECDLDYVPNFAREAKLNVAISNSFGFGGHNACLAVKKYS